MSWFFDAPAGLKDFKTPKDWHDVMAAEAAGIVRDLVGAVVGKNSTDVTSADIATYAADLGYIDPTVNLPSTPGDTLPVAPWGAFPRAVTRLAPWKQYPSVPGDANGSNRASEDLGEEDHQTGVFVDGEGKQLALPVRHRQDEYLEWTVRRNSAGKIARVILVAEGYDYFSTLFDSDEKAVVGLYRDFTEVGTINADDLRAPLGIYRRLPSGKQYEVAKPGAFNPRNSFNINPGIVHLSHRANSLSAEVNLAGVSAIMRTKVDGSVLSGNDSEELLCCCLGGNPNRNSDPLISQQGYAQVRAGYRYTLANPVGLYIAAVQKQSVTGPGNTPIGDDWWSVLRGSGFGKAATSRVLRLEFAPPSGSSLTIDDLKIGGAPIRFGAQVAALATVHLFVTRWKREADGQGPAVPCIGTCCVKTGTQHLVTTSEESACTGKYTLRFPGLVGHPSQAAPGAKSLTR
jgi:hypothetical protein